MTTTYTDVPTLKTFLAIQDDSGFDGDIQMAINGASRAIDDFCQRKFWLDTSPVARTFEPQTLLELDLDNDPLGGDIGSTAGFVVATDASGDGIFETVWATSDYHLLPNNAGSAWPEARPWTKIRAVGTKTFPWLLNTWLTRRDRVQITACWGWPAVPAAVQEACLIKAANLYHRRFSPQGIQGFGEFGPMRISRSEDPDVVNLLFNYQRVGPYLVA